MKCGVKLAGFVVVIINAAQRSGVLDVTKDHTK